MRAPRAASARVFPLLDDGVEFVTPIRAIAHMVHEAHAQGTGFRMQGRLRPGERQLPTA